MKLCAIFSVTPYSLVRMVRFHTMIPWYRYQARRAAGGGYNGTTGQQGNSLKKMQKKVNANLALKIVLK